MLISHSRRFVFIHIPKTGGSSVEKTLLPHARWQERLCLQFPPTRMAIATMNRAMGWTADGYKQYTGIHKHACASVIRAAMPPGLFDQYFRFTVVRNPFDRLVSEFFYRQPYLPQAQAEVGDDGTESLIDRFRDFVREAVCGYVPPMLGFLEEPRTGKLLVNDIAHLETIEADFSRIQRCIGISVIQAIPRTNVSRIRPAIPLQAWYDEPTLKLVVDAYKADFEQFGYPKSLPTTA